MNFTFFKNSKPIYFYFASIISFVISNLSREKNDFLYGVFLVLGAVLFILGFFKSRKNR